MGTSALDRFLGLFARFTGRRRAALRRDDLHPTAKTTPTGAPERLKTL